MGVRSPHPTECVAAFPAIGIVGGMDTSRTYIAPIVLAALQGKVRTTALRQMLAGHYGPIIRGKGHTPFVSLAAVERSRGVKITAEQIAVAVAGRPDRLITVPMPESETVEAASAV